MLITIDRVLDPDDLREAWRRLDGAAWQDGAATAGSLARGVKRNLQLADGVEPALGLGRLILRRLGAHPRFISAALPNRIHPPRFNRYAEGGSYGTHVDSAVMPLPGSDRSLRADLSATLFLSAAQDYDGGELEIETGFGLQSVKLDAGDLVLYPASSLHRVTPVTRGARVASFLWIESLVRDDGDRALLFDLDRTVQQLTPALPPGDPRVLALTGIYHNLLRRWASP